VIPVTLRQSDASNRLVDDVNELWGVLRSKSTHIFIGLLAAVLAFGNPIGLNAEAVAADDQNLPIVDKFIGATLRQQEALKGAEMEVDIDAKLIKLQKQGRLRALRKISQLGQITYKALGFSGDTTVKQEVIARYLAAEAEGRENGSISITPSNYKFKYKGQMDWYGRIVDILQVTPKRKAVGLFKGDLWVDSETGMPVREAGQFVKTPSVFLKKIAFVRDYELRDGMSFPRHIESLAKLLPVNRLQKKSNLGQPQRSPAILQPPPLAK
jgi:hypothetical protein